MNELQTKFPTDTWVCNSWDEYVRLLNSHTKSQGLLLQWTTAIEMSPVGSDHASAHTIIFAVNLFATLKGIPLNGRDNCTYRKAGVQECQPDVSITLETSPGDSLGTTIVNLDHSHQTW